MEARISWMRKALLNVLLLLVVVLLVWYIKDNQSKFNLLKDIDILSLAILSLLALATALVNGWKVKFYTRMFNLHLRFKEWFGLGQITSMTNYLTPFKGGTAVRAFYLRNKHGFPYEQFVATLGASALISFAVYSVAGLFSLAYMFFKMHQSSMVMAGIFLLVLLMSVIAFFFPLEYIQKIRADHFIVRKMKSIIEGWQHIKHNPYNLLMIAFLELSFIVVYSLSLFFGFRAVAVDLPFILCLLVALLSGMSVIITVTPAGLGIKEAVIVWAGSMLGSGILIPLNVAILLRIVAVVWAIPLGLLFSYLLIRENKGEIQ